jgi:hypothetical protein
MPVGKMYDECSAVSVRVVCSCHPQPNVLTNDSPVYRARHWLSEWSDSPVSASGCEWCEAASSCAHAPSLIDAITSQRCRTGGSLQVAVSPCAQLDVATRRNGWQNTDGALQNDGRHLVARQTRNSMKQPPLKHHGTATLTMRCCSSTTQSHTPRPSL